MKFLVKNLESLQNLALAADNDDRITIITIHRDPFRDYTTEYTFLIKDKAIVHLKTEDVEDNNI